ncbi:hypothetical protein ACQKIW_29215 [Bacillus thuringiensis]|uniref:hypothetical protein n=1 Tax=Bacillus thuringiensis TaxID=1428 RepID=UPI003D05A02A
MVEIFVEEESIILQKYKGYDVCPIKGEGFSKHITSSESEMTLSPEGGKETLERKPNVLQKERKKDMMSFQE